MRPEFTFARLAFRQSWQRQPITISTRRLFHFQIRSHAPRKSLHRLRFRTPVLLALLTPAAFVEISEGSRKNGESGEILMLEASRQEIEKELPDEIKGLKKVWKEFVILLDTYIYEPIATGFRFLHLVVIFVPVIATIPIIFIGARQKDREDERSGTLWWYGFLVHSMERAGPAFIKLGQWAASRQDVFPVEMCNIMSSLHSNAPAHSLKDTIRTVEHAFGGRKFKDIFEEFQEQPLGVGAIAQVYKAKLKSDLASISSGSEPNITQRMRKNVDVLVKTMPKRIPSNYVAIKVLHPQVERTVRRDLRIMAFFAAILNAIPTFEWLSFPDEVKQFGEMMRLQLDLRIEAANLTIFRDTFKQRTTAGFPYPYNDCTTREVLVEEFAHGIPLADFLESGAGVFQKELANEGLDSFLRMLLIDNFVHADLHPGNIMVRFYEPEQLDLAFGRHKQSEDPSSGHDVTEQILQRLRPYKHKPEQWIEQLARIDSEGYRPQLIFIDTGLVTSLNAKNRRDFLDLFKAVAEFDGYRAGKLMVERCRQPDAVIEPEIFALKMQHLVLGVKSRTFALGNIKIGDILNQVLSMVRAHHVRLEGDFVNVVLSILLLEGIGRNLDPELDLFRSALPILRQLGSQGGTSEVLKSARQGDWSMLKVWVGLELRNNIQASIEDVSRGFC